MAFPVEELRHEYPALAQAGDFLFFDNAAGAQVPSCALAAITDHLIARNVQRGGPYGRSQEVDAMIARAREAVAAFVNARAPGEIAFGLNATSFIRSISLAIGQALGDRPEIIVTELDHEADIATWVALERVGARIVWWKVRDDGRLDTADLEPLLSRPHETRRVHHGVKCHWRPRRGGGRRETRARGRGRGISRRRAFRSARPDRRSGARLRLPGLFGLQDLCTAHGVCLVPCRGHQQAADIS